MYSQPPGSCSSLSCSSLRVSRALSANASKRSSGTETKARFDIKKSVRSKLVRHRVNQVIHPNANSQGGVLFRIFGEIRPFPGVSNIRIKSQSDHHASLIVID